MTTKKKNVVRFELGTEPGELEVVGGPKPYLWIGSARGRYVGHVPTSQLRSLRDQLTRALAQSTHSGKEDG